MTTKCFGRTHEERYTMRETEAMLDAVIAEGLVERDTVTDICSLTEKGREPAHWEVLARRLGDYRSAEFFARRREGK